MDLREEFGHWLKESGQTMRFASRAVSLSAPVVSEWMAGKYAGNNENVEVKIRSFLKREKDRRAVKIKDAYFIETDVSKRAHEVARRCHLMGKIGVVTADAGVGKTFAVKEYAAQNPDVILIEADQGYTAMALFTALHKELRSHSGKENLHEMVEDVIDCLKDSGRLIIIDEAENLPFKALDLLRRVYDKASVGILLAGMPRLEANLRGHRGQFAQLHSRVFIFAKLKGITADDAAAIASTIITSQDDIYEYLYKAAHCNARSIVLLAQLCQHYSHIHKRPIDKEIIDSAARMMMI